MLKADRELEVAAELGVTAAGVAEELHPRRRRHELRRLVDVPAGPPHARRRLQVGARQSQSEWVERLLGLQGDINGNSNAIYSLVA